MDKQDDIGANARARKRPHGGPWRKGESGNPAGRLSAKELSKRHDIKMLAQQHTKAALKCLVDVMRDKDAPPNARVAAANGVLDRGHGRPQHDVNVTGSLLTNIISLVQGLDEQDEEHTIQ